MKLMHTKTPDFVQKMHNAASKGNKTLVMKGMETVRSGKWASIKTGQIEEITGKTALEEDDNVVKIVRFPGVCVFEPLEETYYEGCKNVMTHTTYTLPTEQ